MHTGGHRSAYYSSSFAAEAEKREPRRTIPPPVPRRCRLRSWPGGRICDREEDKSRWHVNKRIKNSLHKRIKQHNTNMGNHENTPKGQGNKNAEKKQETKKIAPGIARVAAAHRHVCFARFHVSFPQTADVPNDTGSQGILTQFGHDHPFHPPFSLYGKRSRAMAAYGVEAPEAESNIAPRRTLQR